MSVERQTRSWRCPRCGRRFARRNQNHACGADWTEGRHLAQRPRRVVESYRRFLSLARVNGPIELAPTKSYVGVRGTRRNFAGLTPTDEALQGFIVAARRIKDARLRDAIPYQRNLYIHHFSVDTPAELDEDFAAWIREGYAVGAGEHLR